MVTEQQLRAQTHRCERLQVPGGVPASWTTNFHWGDENAWILDWFNNREKWADGVDLVYFAGHAADGGWEVWKTPTMPEPGARMVTPASLSDRHFGAHDLEWIAINGCGPLQDKDIVSGSGSVSASEIGESEAMDRWYKAFGGLHILLGFAEVILDNEDQGRRFAEFALKGQTVIDAWFSAATITQANGACFAAAMYPGMTTCRGQDRRPGPSLGSSGASGSGLGFVSEDVPDPDYFILMWTSL